MIPVNVVAFHFPIRESLAKSLSVTLKNLDYRKC